MKFGSFGGVVFEVSSDRILTFEDESQSHSARWHFHERPMRTAVPEFLGPSWSQHTLKVKLRATWGVNPQVELDKLKAISRTGQVHPLVLTTKGPEGKFALESINVSGVQRDNKGNMIAADVELRFLQMAYSPPLKYKEPIKKIPSNASNRKPVGSIQVQAIDFMYSKPSVKSVKAGVVTPGQKLNVFEVVNVGDGYFFNVGAKKYVHSLRVIFEVVNKNA